MVQVLEEELISSYWMMKIQSMSPVIMSITAITSITCMALAMHPRLACPARLASSWAAICRPVPARLASSWATIYRPIYARALAWYSGLLHVARLAVGCHAVYDIVSITCLSSWYDHQTYAWCSSA
jgi:hypothetical protein